MRKLIYSMTVSLDGFIAGRDGEIDWSAPDEELPSVSQPADGGVRRAPLRTGAVRDDALLGDRRGGPVGRGVLARVRAHLEGPAEDRLLEDPREVEGNARLVRRQRCRRGREGSRNNRARTWPSAAPAWRATCMKLGLIDEYRLFVRPVVLGGGTPYFPALDGRINLELVETQTFGSRVVYVRYRVSPAR